MPEKLLNLIRRNKKIAQHDFYKKYSVQMFRLTYRYVNNELDAGSIVNSGFYKIFKNINNFNFKGEESLIAWMRKIIINEALMFLRTRINYEEINELSYKNNGSENFQQDNLQLEDYYRMIKKLPSDLKVVFNLYAIDGYSHKEIAEQLSIKESSSRVYLTRARKILQQKLKRN